MFANVKNMKCTKQPMDYKKTLEQVIVLLNNAEELNMNNYNEEQVRLLNDTFIEVYLFIESALAESQSKDGKLPIPHVISSVCEHPKKNRFYDRDDRLRCSECHKVIEQTVL